MAKINRSEPNTPPRTSIGAILAVVVVVGVFVVLGFTLANPARNGAETATAPTADTLPTAGTAAVAPQSAATEPAAPEQTVDAAIAARNNKYQAAPPMAIDPNKNYIATITTPRGDIEVKLLPKIAPETVNNFVFLAKDGFYDGVTWHRVLQGFMAQSGDPTGTGTGGPGYSIKGETAGNPTFDKPGLLAMANSGSPDTAGSQFFITTAPATFLNGGYTVFGEVTKGQEIVDGIPLRDPQQSPTTLGEQISKVTISEQ